MTSCSDLILVLRCGRCRTVLDAPPLPKAKASKARPKLALSAFQPLERDFAFIVDAEVEADGLVARLAEVDRQRQPDVAEADDPYLHDRGV